MHLDDVHQDVGVRRLPYRFERATASVPSIVVTSASMESVGVLVPVGHRSRRHVYVGTHFSEPLHDGLVPAPFELPVTMRPATVETIAIWNLGDISLSTEDRRSPDLVSSCGRRRSKVRRRAIPQREPVVGVRHRRP